MLSQTASLLSSSHVRLRLAACEFDIPQMAFEEKVGPEDAIRVVLFPTSFRARKLSFGDARSAQDSESGVEPGKSQFLRLFGRRALSPRSSVESLAGNAKTVLPMLPPELWVHILHLAASPSHPFLSSTIITPSTSISFLEYPHSHSHLIPAYRDSMRFKCQLTLVSKLWHSIAQEVLFEFIWITKAKEAELLAKLLSDKALRGFESTIRAHNCLPASKRKGKQRDRQSSLDLPPCRISDETNFEYDRNGAYTYAYDTRGVGRHIRRLHIETASLDRCSPQALLNILDHAPLLQIFSDYRSIRRNANFQIHSPSTLSTSEPPATHIISFRDFSENYQSADHKVLSALLTHPNRSTALRRLSWTNYDYKPHDYDAIVRFYLRVVGPKLQMASENLDFLELTLCAKDLGRSRGGFLDSFLNPTPTVAVRNLTSTASFSSSTSVLTQTPDATLSALAASPLHLPALRSLKVTLDNATFHVLSLWDMPALTNFSVVSADFSYAGEGFRMFFTTHGWKIKQLELGHSSGAIEEFWLTSPHAQQQQQQQPGGEWGLGSMKVPLAEWCPHLIEFICSAEAEWSWENPDWIAPHVLLPSHPTLTFIGVRDLEKRIVEGLQSVEGMDAEALMKGGELYGVEEPVMGDSAFFVLHEQFGSLVNKVAFPSLRFLRDLSWESAEMRTNGRVKVRESGRGGAAFSMTADLGSVGGGGGRGQMQSTNFGGFLAALVRIPPSTYGPAPLPPPPLLPLEPLQPERMSEKELVRRREMQQGRRVLRFWARVSKLCRDNGIWLEDCDGMLVTSGGLMKTAREVHF